MSDRPLKVWFAEDDLDDRILTEDAIAEMDSDVELRHFPDGRALWDALLAAVSARSELPRLLLLDLNMPRMSGLEVIDAVRGNTNTRFIPIVVLTTSTDPEEVRRTYDHGINSFISKPVTHTSFQETVHEAIRYWAELSKLPGTSL